jgi:hypothetical protein
MFQLNNAPYPKILTKIIRKRLSRIMEIKPGDENIVKPQ